MLKAEPLQLGRPQIVKSNQQVNVKNTSFSNADLVLELFNDHVYSCK